MIAWIILGIVIVVALILIGLYNNMVHLRLKVKNAWAQIDTQLKRRFDLIPNLIETVKGYMSHEKETLTKLTEARNKFVEASDITDKSNANNSLENGLKSIFALAEAYPDLKSNQNFETLQHDLSDTENKIAYARQFYNDTVQMYNTAIMTFPGNMFAKMFGFKEEKFFEANETEKENVKVNF